MKVCGIYIGAFKGATMFEAQVWRVHARLLRPRFWCKRNWPFIRVGRERP